MARRERDSKYLRLTGLWESKKGGLFTGKLRAEDVEKLIEKCEEADKANSQIVFFLWENDQKRNRKDPDFTLQAAVADEEQSSRRRSSRDDDDEEEDKPKRRGKRDEPDDDEEEEEKPKRTSKTTKSKKNDDW